MRIAASLPLLKSSSPSTSTLHPKTVAHALDKKYWFDDTGYDAVATLPKARLLPRRSDVSSAIRVFKKWADGAELHKIDLGHGKSGFALMWNADEAGGIELFDSKGKRFASQGWGDEGPQKDWTFGASSVWYTEAKDDLANG